jgi:hypothetical protein
MSKRKTQLTDTSVDDFVDTIEDESRRKDCRAIAQLMRAATGQEPRMWGTSIIGFGKRHFQYANRKPAELCKVGFARRKRSFAFYLPKFPEHAALIEQLGKHSYGGGCLHLASLDGVDAEILERMIEKAYTVGAEDCR